MYAKESQIGQTLRCPDCFTDVPVKAPKVAPPPPKKKTLDELEEFQLSDPGERPTYKPMIEARGEYAELQLLDTKAPPRKEQTAPRGDMVVPGLPDTVDPLLNESHFPVPLGPPVAAPAPTTPQTAVIGGEEDLDDQEVVLSAPVERIETKTEIKVPDLPPPKRDERKEPTWNDDEWGFIADPRQAGSWQKSPFYVGLLSIFLDLQLGLRIAAYSVGVAIVLSMIGNAAILADPDGPQTIKAIFTFLAAMILGFLILMSFSPCLLVIATDTADGESKVKEWPGWDIGEWIGSAFYIPIAAFVAVLPGGFLACLLLLGGQFWLAPFPPLMSFLLLFPIPFTSIVSESSPVHLISSNVLKSLRSHGDGWISLYVLSFFIFMVATAATAIIETGVAVGRGVHYVLAAMAAPVLVLLIVLYFRLLGRLMWYTQNGKKSLSAMP
jgi:hypothetical protein